MEWEFSFLYALQELHGPVLDNIMVFITRLGNDGLIWIIPAVLMLFSKKWRPCGIGMLLALLCKVAVGDMLLKETVMRDRPCWLDPGVQLLVSAPSSYSFPSGHTFDAFAAASTVWLHHKKAGIAALILAAAIGFSRLYLFVHFPTDVLASVVLGFLSAFVVYKVMDQVYYRKKGVRLPDRAKKL